MSSPSTQMSEVVHNLKIMTGTPHFNTETCHIEINLDTLQTHYEEMIHPFLRLINFPIPDEDVDDQEKIVRQIEEARDKYLNSTYIDVGHLTICVSGEKYNESYEPTSYGPVEISIKSPVINYSMILHLLASSMYDKNTDDRYIYRIEDIYTEDKHPNTLYITIVPE